MELIQSPHEDQEKTMSGFILIGAGINLMFCRLIHLMNSKSCLIQCCMLFNVIIEREVLYICCYRKFKVITLIWTKMIILSVSIAINFLSQTIF